MNKKSRFKIAILLPCIKFGGAERVAITLAKAFISADISVDLLLMSYEGEFLPEALSIMNVVDLKVDRTYKLPSALSSYITKSDPDLVISSFWKLNLCACLVKIRHPKVKLFLWEHAIIGGSSKFTTFLFGVTSSIIYQVSDRVIAVSNGVRDSILDASIGLKRKVMVISNPIEPPCSEIQEIISSRVKVQGQFKNIIWIGRLSYPKNPTLALEAFNVLSNKLKVHLTFVGDGDMRSALEARTLEMGLQDKVKFVGFQRNPYKYLASSDLLVLSSDFEGFGNVLIEAMFCGLRVVSTKCSNSINEILEFGRYGTSVQVGDSLALASAIEVELNTETVASNQINGAMRFHPTKIARIYLNEIEVPS